MNYNDFPILDDHSYEIMREQFSQSFTDSHELIAKIFNTLSSLNLAEIENIKSFNTNLTSAIIDSKLAMKQSLDNLSKTFNITTSSKQTIKAMSIHSYLNEITTLIVNLKTINQETSKQIIKNITSKTIDVMLDYLKNILSALSKTSIQFFKHM